MEGFKPLILQPAAHIAHAREYWLRMHDAMHSAVLQSQDIQRITWPSYRQTRCHGISCHISQLATGLLAALCVADHISAVQNECHRYYQQIICMLQGAVRNGVRSAPWPALANLMQGAA